jgi:hypothetical protein
MIPLYAPSLPSETTRLRYTRDLPPCAPSLPTETASQRKPHACDTRETLRCAPFHPTGNHTHAAHEGPPHMPFPCQTGLQMLRRLAQLPPANGIQLEGELGGPPDPARLPEGSQSRLPCGLPRGLPGGPSAGALLLHPLNRLVCGPQPPAASRRGFLLSHPRHAFLETATSFFRPTPTGLP